MTARAKIRAVVADDGDDMRALLVAGLRASGRVDVLAAEADGLAALDAVRTHRPDLALLDLGMPRAGGLEVLADIRATSPATRVVVVSGYPREELIDLVVERGAAGYVRKRPSITALVDDVIGAASVLDVADEVLASARTSLAPEVWSGREARRFADETLTPWITQDMLDTVRLLLSELVTNAVVHARSAPDVAVLVTADALRVEVGDDDPRIPEPKTAAEFDTSGRGLAILEANVARWGVDRRGAGKVVWFELPRR
ncbi:MAG TPA: response regulator [Acidimicrobiales bacterium]|nr:response regulator [Acidimicrobiales bacterium]